MRVMPAIGLLSLVLPWVVDGQTYIINTVAGNGTFGFSGDNGPATAAQLHQPVNVAVDATGSIYIADTGNFRVRKVSNGIMTTVAGNGTYNSTGDGGLAVNASFQAPYAVAVDSAVNLFIADNVRNIIREVSKGVITTVVGGGKPESGVGPAMSIFLADPSGVAVDPAGSIYIADTGYSRILKFTNGAITTVAGTPGGHGFGGDGGLATNALLYGPSGIAVDSLGTLFIADSGNNRIRRVSNGVITTVAGNGTRGFGGDGGPAISAMLNDPTGVAVDSAGNLYIADRDNNRIRKVVGGVISTLAGNGLGGAFGSFGGDGGPAINAGLSLPSGIVLDSVGNVYIADSGNQSIRILKPASSTCTYSAAPTSILVSPSGGSVTVSLQTASSCAWTVSALPTWISVSGAASGTGSASVVFVVSPNPGAPRSGTLSIAGVSVIITQPTMVPTITAIENAASSLPGISPGSWVTIYGVSVAGTTRVWNATDFNGTNLPTQLDLVGVTINGKAAYISYVSPTQINVLSPADATQGTVPVQVTYAGARSNILYATENPYAPALFTFSPPGQQYVAATHADGRLIGSTALYPGLTTPATSGEIITFYGTGFGPTDPATDVGQVFNSTPIIPIPPTVTIGGYYANVLWAGLVAPGEYQFNVLVPVGPKSGDNAVLVSVSGGPFTQPNTYVTLK
jgi:uncharacterized protein (TIGR03437 family)